MDKKTKGQDSTDAEKSLTKPNKKQPDSTDPQENMEGPLSSIMQNIKEGAEENDKESKEEADKKKDENT